jgi:hypothetical protein
MKSKSKLLTLRLKKDHLTSFSLLLTGTNNDDPCASSGNYVISYFSLAVVIVAIIIVVISSAAYEIRIRYRARSNEKGWRSMSLRTSSVLNNSSVQTV